MLHPFAVRTISSGYGYRVHPDLARREHHAALDYKVPAGSAVRAIATGVVAAVRWDDRMGHVVEIDHGAGYRSRYAHLADAPALETGDHVDSSTVIGAVGQTGRAARGDHLHLELWHHGRHIDPSHQLTERP